MKQINNSPDKSVLLRETFNSEASVRLNGGVCANVDFKSGKAFFQNTGSITYSNPVLSIGAFTIRARVKLTIVNQYNVIASFDNVSTIELRTDLGGELVMYVDSVKKSSGKVLAVNTWYDIVVTRDDSGVIIFYVNGESFSGGTQAGIFYNKNLTIGKRGAGTTLYYNGYMDLFEYYDRSMTAAEITYILNDRAFRITDQVKRDRVAISGGTQGKIIYYKSLITFYRKRGMWDKTHLCLVPFLGYKAYSGLIDTVYDLKGAILKNNDATQGTTANKPRIAGNIAPNEVLAAKNPNGENAYMSYPTISFADAAPYSIVCMLNWNGHIGQFSGIINCNHPKNDRAILLRSTTNRFSLSNANSDEYWGTLNNSKIIGKNSTIHFIYNNNRNVDIYIDKVLFETIAMANSSISSSFFITGYLANLSLNFGCAAKWYYYRIQSGAMTPSQITAEYDLLRSWIPEIESVTIGSQVWASSNLDVVATPLGNVIPEVTLAGAVEKIVNGGFDNTSAWVVTPPSSITGGKLVFNGSSPFPWVYQEIGLKIGKWYKVSGTVSDYVSGNLTALFGASTAQITLSSGNGVFLRYVKVSQSATSGTIYFGIEESPVLSLDNFSVQELNWSNATEIYDAVYAATSGTAAEKHYAAVKEAAMWCSYNNDTANQAIYGKQYNHYAKDLLKADMLSQSFGYHITTESEWTSLAALGGYKLRKEGTTYWSEATGTNTTGFTALGGGKRLTSGVFQGLLTNVAYWVGDTQKVVIISGNTVVIQAANTQEGNYIRLTKD